MAIPIDPVGVAQVGYGVFRAVKSWWKNQRPICKILGGIADNKKVVRIFVRDFLIPAGSPLLSQDAGGVGLVPNVYELWPRVEGIALANVLNVMGVAGKTMNIEVIEMSKDNGLWDSDMIVLGAQAQKCVDFYQRMKNVAYVVDPYEIRDAITGAIVPRETGFGYGIILKAANPYSRNGVGLLIGGYGVLGTEAASYYFRRNCADLGRQFGRRYFGIVVRASLTAGIGSTERQSAFDKRVD